MLTRDAEDGVLKICEVDMLVGLKGREGCRILYMPGDILNWMVKWIWVD